ncbi:hypothetical protein [Candidatus Nanohalococcus occultus]|uniref:hypothetical protein n=1 Tax=Candidatus Nanohalococcus occultus TaxID=2978047 RepID=UPI0039E0528F
MGVDEYDNDNYLVREEMNQIRDGDYTVENTGAGYDGEITDTGLEELSADEMVENSILGGESE